MESEFGCCRAEPFTCRKPYEMFSFLLSRYRLKPEYDPNRPCTDDSLANHSQRWRVYLNTDFIITAKLSMNLKFGYSVQHYLLAVDDVMLFNF